MRLIKHFFARWDPDFNEGDPSPCTAFDFSSAERDGLSDI